MYVHTVHVCMYICIHVNVCEGGGENRNIWRTFAHFDLLPTLKEGHPPLLIAKIRRPADAQKLLHRAAKPCGRGLALRRNLLCFSRDARPQELPAFSKQSSCKHFEGRLFFVLRTLVDLLGHRLSRMRLD